MLKLQTLLCPVVRPATEEDAPGIAEVMLRSNSRLIRDVFGNNYKGAFRLLTDLYSKHYQGVHILQEGDELIGVMKLHLPGLKIGKTVSLLSLMRHIGIFKGIRAMMLMSNWDEYKLSTGEGYIEFLSVKDEWKGIGCEKILFSRAEKLAEHSGAVYLTKFEPLRDYITIGHLERHGFIPKKKIYSPLARIIGTTYVWRKYVCSIDNAPLTVKDHVINIYNDMKSRWQVRRQESDSALRISLMMTTIPIVGGTLAAVRGYPLAAIGWFILIGMHLLGALLLFREFIFGKYLISVAMVSESINLVYRALVTDSWFDRGWLLPIALINIWILISIMRAPKIRELKKYEEQNSLIAMNEILQKNKISI